MMMPGRQFSAGSGYRYGFNGKENDNDVKGEGNQQDYGMRIYDPRLGKFLSVDPLTKKFTRLTPYQFASNTPIWAIDLDGLEGLAGAPPHVMAQMYGPKLLTKDEIKTKTQKTIEALSAKIKVPDNPESWTTGDVIKWKLNGNSYLFEEKTNFVRDYREAIKAASMEYDIPERLLGGVVFAEFGGDPMWIDDVAYTVRDGTPGTKDKSLTSFGNVSIQIRRAAATLGYDVTNLSNPQRDVIIGALKDPVQNIFISAKHLAELRDIDFQNKTAASLTDNDIKIIATRYNRGTELSLNHIKENLSYGEALLMHKVEVQGALKNLPSITNQTSQ